MTWIRTVPMSEADDRLKQAIESQRDLYPTEYATPGASDRRRHFRHRGLAQLIPDALFHAFSTFGSLMSPDLPLTRRQHEMITTVVSATNRCVY